MISNTFVLTDVKRDECLQKIDGNEFDDEEKPKEGTGGPHWKHLRVSFVDGFGLVELAPNLAGRSV
jgi:hypothetical protein